MRPYGGSPLASQELDFKLIEDVVGRLFPRALIEGSRVPPVTPPGLLRK